VGPWGFVGRTDELNRLISAATCGTGRGLIYSGSAGVGKSRLLRQGVATLPADRFAVSYAAANIATAGLPFGGLAPVLPTDQPSGVSPAGLLRWAVDSLHQQAAGRAIVLAVDDAHLLDPSSAALAYLVARAEGATVLATLRDGEPVPHPIRALWTDDLVDYAELQPMSEVDTAQLLIEMLGGPVDSASAERLFRLSAGNALMLRELVLAGTGSHEIDTSYGIWRWTGRLELAPSLTDMIDNRIGRLSPEVRTVLELVALGEPVGLPLLAGATDPVAVETAEERGLIRVDVEDRRANVRLAHPLYGEVVRRRCPVSRTRRLLASLAELVEKTGAQRREDLLRVAVWRLDSDTARDPAPLLEAAGQAFATFDVPLAARLARAAMDAGGGFAAGELLATILMFGDQPEQALAVLDRVRGELTTDARRGRWLTARGLASYWGLSRESTVDELREDADRLTDPSDRARVRAFEALMRLHGLQYAETVRLAHAILDRPAAPASSRALARCGLAHLQAARGEMALSARTIAAIEADRAQWRTDMPYLQLALELARGTLLPLSGDLAGIDAIVAAEFADLADAGDFRLGSGYLAVLRAQAARLRGHTAEALRCSLQACAILATSRVFAGLAQAERAYAAALRGETAVAQEAMTDSDRAHTATMSILYPWREQARAWVEACAGRIDPAVGVLRDLIGRLRADGFAGHELSALHDLVRLGRAAEAVDRIAELAGRVDGPLAELIVRHAHAAAGDDPDALLAIAEGFATLGLQLYAAEAAAQAVTLLRSRRSSRAAASRATGADQGSHARGAAAARLGELMERCDARTPALTASRPTLTDREAQIARLAADGVSSREIADRLFLSIRTVDNHLTRVYTKLGVTRRTELAAALWAVPDLG
jgi:DNA-binding CsgD family transcriptional regulator